MDKLLLNPKEAAEMLGIGRSKVYELMASGRLPSVKVDGCRRVARSDLMAFVESLKARAA